MASRVTAGVAGSYALAALWTRAVAPALPLPRLEASLWPTLTASWVYVIALLACFAARSATRAWLGLGLAALPLIALAWWRGGGS